MVQLIKKHTNVLNSKMHGDVCSAVPNSQTRLTISAVEKNRRCSIISCNRCSVKKCATIRFSAISSKCSIISVCSTIWDTRVHISNNWIITGICKGLAGDSPSSVWRLEGTSTNDHVLTIRSLGTNVSNIWIKIQKYIFEKRRFNLSFANCSHFVKHPVFVQPQCFLYAAVVWCCQNIIPVSWRSRLDITDML